MKSTVCLLLLATSIGASLAQTDPALLEMPDLGLVMTHPKTWQITQIKKTTDFKILMPIEGSSQKALLELFNVGFNSEKEIWQLSQKGINDRMKREIMRQWEEELLGVPMLLTKVSYTDKEGPHIMLTGLIYSRTPKKLMFRLDAAPDDYDKAEFAFRETMNTFRTGRPWTPEDPTQKPDPKIGKISQPPAVVTNPKSLDGEIKMTKPKVAIPIDLGGRKLELRIPGEWAGKVNEDGSVTLTNPEVGPQIRVFLASTLDSEPPGRALLTASSKTLEDFAKVIKRDETAPERNRAGATFSSVWRSGTNAKGDLYTCDAVVLNGDYYAVVAYRTESVSKIGSERKQVESLLQLMTVERLP